jgi:hypothetical protein
MPATRQLCGARPGWDRSALARQPDAAPVYRRSADQPVAGMGQPYQRAGNLQRLLAPRDRWHCSRHLPARNPATHTLLDACLAGPRAGGRIYRARYVVLPPQYSADRSGALDADRELPSVCHGRCRLLHPAAATKPVAARCHPPGTNWSEHDCGHRLAKLARKLSNGSRLRLRRGDYLCCLSAEHAAFAPGLEDPGTEPGNRGRVIAGRRHARCSRDVRRRVSCPTASVCCSSPAACRTSRPPRLV